jgi:hypothetical protein
MSEGYGNPSSGYVGSSTAQNYATDAPKREKQVLGAHSQLDYEQERTFKLVEELENALQGVLSSPKPEATGESNPQEVLPPLGELIRATRNRQRTINDRLHSIVSRLEV